MKITHYNYTDNSGRIYCHHLDNIISPDEEFVNDNCAKCPFYTDTLLGYTGVLCSFDDGCHETNPSFDDAGDSEYHSKMMYYRLGLKTKNEVINSLKSYNDYDSEREAEETESENGDEKETGKEGK